MYLCGFPMLLKAAEVHRFLGSRASVLQGEVASDASDGAVAGSVVTRVNAVASMVVPISLDAVDDIIIGDAEGAAVADVGDVDGVQAFPEVSAVVGLDDVLELVELKSVVAVDDVEEVVEMRAVEGDLSELVEPAVEDDVVAELVEVVDDVAELFESVDDVTELLEAVDDVAELVEVVDDATELVEAVDDVPELVEATELELLEAAVDDVPEVVKEAVDDVLELVEADVPGAVVVLQVLEEVSD